MPRYFVKSRVMRQAIFSYGCLGLWATLDLEEVLLADLSDEKEVLMLQERGVGNLSLLFKDSSVFGEDEDTNVFRRTAIYYSETLKESQNTLRMLQTTELQSESSLENLICIILSSSLVFGFLACHPHRVVPLIAFPDENEEVKTDIIGVVCGVKRLVLGSLDRLRETDVGDLFQRDEFDALPRKKISIVEELRKQVNDYYHSIQFLDIVDEDSDAISIFSVSIVMLQKALAACIKYNYPVALFRWLFSIPVGFADLARQKHWLALRILFVYSCLCLYCKFCIHRECVWRDYVEWFHQEYLPLCPFDSRLYHYVITRDKLVLNGKYLFLEKFDIWSPEFDFDEAESV